MVIPDVCIVSGAGRGIGRAVVERLCGLETRVIGVSRAPSSFYSANYRHIEQDLTTEGVLERVFDAIGSLHSGARIGVVLCASQIGNYGGILSSPNFENWLSLYNVNVISNLRLLEGLIRRFKRSVFRVVFFAGGGAAYAYPDFFGYSLTKVSTVRAVENIGHEFKTQLPSSSIVALAPGAVDTDMLKIVLQNGGLVKTQTDIAEPVTFSEHFICDVIKSEGLNGRFVHVRDISEGLVIDDLRPEQLMLRRQP